MADEWAPSEWLERLCQDQRDRWRRGEKPRVESYLKRHPEFRADEKLLLDLIYSEYLLREQHGETPTLGEYQERFPELRTQLDALFQVLDAMDDESSLGLRGLETTSFTKEPITSRAGSNDTISGGGVKRADPLAEARKAAAPKIFGPYELLEEVARGGMGIVYKARQPKLNRIVALKMILPGNFDSESAVRRFQIEAEAAAKLDHPCVVPIFDVGEHDGQPYLCMAFIDGESLAARLAKGWIPAPEAARILRDVAEAVHHAHERGIVHRDLKPANILMDRAGRPRVTDFGLARRFDVPTSLSLDGSIIGTPSYMSPEQASGRTASVGPACDIYSLGAVLFHLLTGQPPFKGSNALEIIRQVCEEPTPAPRSLNPSVPKALNAVCLRCLAKNPDQRYLTAGQMADELSRCLQDFSATTVIKESLPAPSKRRPTRSLTPRIAATVAVLAVLAVALVWLVGAMRGFRGNEMVSVAQQDVAQPEVSQPKKNVKQTTVSQTTASSAAVSPTPVLPIPAPPNAATQGPATQGPATPAPVATVSTVTRRVPATAVSSGTVSPAPVSSAPAPVSANTVSANPVSPARVSPVPATQAPALAQPEVVDPAEPLTGDVAVIVGDGSKTGARKRLRFDQPGALPLRNGDAVQVEARTNRPAYLYLIWIDEAGTALPIYPWRPGHWENRAFRDKPATSLLFPAADADENEQGFVNEGSAGMETLVLLGRDTPLPDEVVLKDLLAGLPSQPLEKGRLMVWLERGEQPVAATRSLNFGKTQTIYGGALEMKRQLTKRLKPHFRMIRAVSLANRGS